MTKSIRVVVPRPQRVRSIKDGPFGWLDTRLVKDGWLEVLSSDAVAVYAFLCLVANRQGVSWYRRDRIGRMVGLGETEVATALDRLCQLELVAYHPFSRHAADGFYQVLAVPAGGPPAPHNRLMELMASIGT